jgi:hypothetical protein
MAPDRIMRAAYQSPFALAVQAVLKVKSSPVRSNRRRMPSATLATLEERRARAPAPLASSWRKRLSDSEMSNDDDPTNSAIARRSESLSAASASASSTTASTTDVSRIEGSPTGNPFNSLYGIASTRPSTRRVTVSVGPGGCRSAARCSEAPVPR